MTPIGRSAEYRSFAEQHAAAFGQATMAKISAALAEHNAAVAAAKGNAMRAKRR